MASVPSNLIPVSITQLPVSATTSEDVLLVGVYQGVTYKFRAGDLLQVAGVPLSRQVIAGTGLTGGGALSSNVTLSVAPGGIGTTQLAASGVTPGVYGDGSNVPQFTVDATGRVMAATSVPLSITGFVPTTREVIAGNGLTGGGPLSSNVTLAVNYGGTPLTGTGSGSAGSALTVSRSDHRHPAVDLTDQTQIDGILPIDQGGTGRSLTMQPGAVMWSGSDGLYVGPVGTSGQVLVSGGTGAPTWGSTLIVAPMAANTFFAGPTAGGVADPVLRTMVNADLPASGAVAATYGSGSLVPVLVVNSKGVITSASSTAVTPAWANVTGTPTTIAGYGITDGVTLTGAQALTNKTIDASLNTLSNIPNAALSFSSIAFTYSGGITGSASVALGGTNAMSLSNVPNASLANSSITINGSSVSLGGSITVTATASAALTIGTGLSGTSYNGSTAVTIANTGVLSFDGGTTGLTPATATTGAVTLAGTLVVANGGTGATTAASARTNLGATTVGSNMFTLTNPSAVTFPRFNADNTVSALDAATFRTAIGAGTGTVTSVTATAPVSSTGGATPVISMAAASSIANGYLTSTDWSTFNNKQPAGAYLTGVTADAPMTGAGTAASHLRIPAATSLVSGYLTSTDWATFNAKQPAGSYLTSVAIASANGLAGTSSGGTTPTITLTTSITGLLKGNGTAISAATAGTDYSAGTSALATGILKSTTATGALSIAVAGDFPTLNQNTTGTAANVTGTVAIANGGTGATTAASARTNLGATTLGSNLFTITNVAAIAFPRFNADNTVSSLNAASFRSAIGAGTGNGTVTSVAMTVPTGLSVSGSPITGSGTFAVTMTAGYAIPTTASQANWDSAYTDRLKWDGGATGLVAATGRTSLGGTTVGQSMFTLTNPSAITFPRFNADNTVSALDAASFRTAIGVGTGTGTVIDVTGLSPVLSSGGISPEISLASGYGDTQNPYASKAAGLVLASPSGSAGVPSFRALAASDVPTLNQNTTGTASNVTGVVAIANGGTGATTAATARANLSAAVLGANNDITSMTALTGGISSPDFIQFDTAAGATDATGKLHYNNADMYQTLQFQMNGSVVQHVGEEMFYRVKLSAPATKGQVLMFTGTLGASGGLKAAPATGLQPDQSSYILGIAGESGTTNGWITVYEFGEVKNIDTTGGAEAWTQGDVLYYNPLVAGGLTKTKPNTPNAIALVAAVVKVGVSNGILFVRPTFGSVLGGTDGNVQFSTLSSGDVIVYDSGDSRWENRAQSTLAVGTATNLAGGAASQIPYQTGAGATGFIANGTAGQVLTSAGAGTPVWSGISGGTF